MQLARDQLARAHRLMRTIRAFEERVHQGGATGDSPGFVHLYAGQEAPAVGVCLDRAMNPAARFRDMFGGTARTPMVPRATFGAGTSSAGQHSQTLHPVLTRIPGLKVVPSNPHDAEGSLIQAIRDDDPVVFLEHKAPHDAEGEVPDASCGVPFAEARVVREGGGATIVAFGRLVGVAARAADAPAREGVDRAVLDPRTTSPPDRDTISGMVEETGRLVVVDEASPRRGMAAGVARLVAEGASGALEALWGLRLGSVSYPGGEAYEARAARRLWHQRSPDL